MDGATIISLLVLVAMSAMFLSGKCSFGLAAMGCVVALVITNVLTIPEAFAGFTSQSNILVACMFTICLALSKTNIPYYSAGLLQKVDRKNDTKFVIGVLLIFILLITIISETPALPLVVSFLATIPLKEGSKITPSKLLMPYVLIVAGFSFLIPIGMGAAVDMMANGFAGGVVPEDQLLNFGDILRVRIPASIFCFIYVAVMWKYYPEGEIGAATGNAAAVEKSSLPKWKEMVVYVVLACVVAGLIFNANLGAYAYIIPMVCVLVLRVLNIVDQKETINTLMGNVTWLLVGIAAVTAAINKTGGAAVIGKLLAPLLSWTDNGFLLILIVCAFTTVMTTLFSNVACWSILTPLVATVALEVGINPKSLIVAVGSCFIYAFMLPSGSATIAMAYEMGHLKASKMFKYNLPLLIGMIFITAVSIYFIFPPF